MGMAIPSGHRRFFRSAWRCGVTFVAGLIALVAPARAARAEDADARDGTRLFREKIEPVLKARCFRCHSEDAEKLKGGLRLDSRAGMFTGGDTGPAIVSGKSEESLLIQAIRHDGGLAMPP